MRKPQSQKVSQSWIKITWFSAKFEFRFESFKSKFTLILSVSKLMTGCSKNNRENYPRKCFWTKEKETRVKFNPRSSANQLSNNWALVHLLVLPMLFIAVNSPNLVHQHWKDQKTAKCPKPLGYCFIWPCKHRSLNCLISDTGTADGEGLVGPRPRHFFASPPPLFVLKRKTIKIKKRLETSFFRLYSDIFSVFSLISNARHFVGLLCFSR